MRGPQTDDSETGRAGRSHTPTPRRSWSRPRRRRAKFGALGLAALGVTGGLLAASALGAPTPAPPSVGLKVLLIGSGSADPTTVAWESALSSEGVPYTEVTATNTGAPGSWQVALPALTNGTQGNYNAVVIADSPTDFAAGQLGALATYEGQYNVRQLDGYVTGFPSAPPNLGVANDPTGAAITASSESLTAAGTAALPGLAGSVPFDAGSYAYPGTVSSSAFTSWVSFGGTTSLGGVYQHPSTDAQKNVQEAALFFAYNQYQEQWRVLSRGLIDWVTQNAHLGLFRNYVSLHLDDVFNSDNTWDTSSHTTSLTAAAQMSAADMAAAAQWSRLNSFRIDWAFNGGASSANDTPATADPLLAKFQSTDPATGKPYSQDFGWINHTWDHATLDQGCATQNYIEAELNQNAAFATASGSGGLGGLGLTADPNGTSNGDGSFDVHAFVPGEHSGLANLIPGATASIDAVDTTAAAGGSGGSFTTVGTYNYAVTAQYIYNTGDSQTQTASVRVAAGQTVSINWAGVCKAASYRVYRQNPGSTTWTYIATVSPPNPETLNPSSTANTAGGGMAPVSYTDTGAAGTATTLVPSLTATTALEYPYEQNQSFNAAITAAGITAIGGDASKPYPNPPTTLLGINTTTPYTGATFAAGQSFADGTAQVVPRHPINVYYNVATWPEEIDEYNTIYPGTNSTEASIINQVEPGMFSTITNNDPEPFYAHQTNLVGASASSSVLIPVLTQFETQYHSVFSPAEPYVQPTLPQSAVTAQRQQAWAAAVAAGSVTATEQGGTIVIKNTGAQIDIPINAPTGTLIGPGGTPFGSAYAGSLSDWVTVPAGGTDTLQAPAAPYVTTQPANQGVQAGQTATFTAAATNGQANPPATVQWYVSTDTGVTWNPIAGATGTTLTLTGTTASMSGNEYEAIFTNIVGSATSNAATLGVGQTGQTVPTISSAPNATPISYGQALSSAILSGGSVTAPNGSGGTTSVPGTWSFATPSAQPGLGIANQQVVFTPNDTSSYTTVTTQVPVTVNKATLIVAPDAKTVTYGGAAPSYTLAVTGFAKQETTITAAGYVAPTCTSTYTPTTAVSASPLAITCSGGAATDYVFSYSTGVVTIVKATPTITRVPTASQIRFGQTLARSTLSRGSASIAGTFAWSNPTLVPPRGSSSQQVTFTPRDTVDFNAVTGIRVNVQAN
jgi:hypothetical protein